MPLPILGAILGIGEKLIDKLIPDPAAKAAALLKLKELEQSGDLAVIGGQLEINKIEAANPNKFISGWRPAVGWVCVSGLAIQYVLSPLLEWGTLLASHPVKGPTLDMATLMPLLTGLLGLAGLRTYEKVKAAEGNR